MATYQLFFATNRNHVGTDRWHPTSYGKTFSADGMENLRFGSLSVETDDAVVVELLDARGSFGKGDGIELGAYLGECAKNARITAYQETLDPSISESSQNNSVLGSAGFFSDLQTIMKGGSDVVVYIHGFNVSWYSAVGSALALQLMLNRQDGLIPEQVVKVVLFTWPSDGQALPFVSYKSDRSEAIGSGFAVGRAFLKLRDFLIQIKDRKDPALLCGQDIQLLCHSMGNFVLQNALQRMGDHTPGSALPRLFENVFLCASDVDDDALETDQPLEGVDEISRSVSVYFNGSDKALWISDYTKGNPERLGTSGAAHPNSIHKKIHQIDCRKVADVDHVEHSYYLCGETNLDIRISIEGISQEDNRRARRPIENRPNTWVL